jgi:branched-chain amino acid transport system ATP-binding protein
LGGPVLTLNGTRENSSKERTDGPPLLHFENVVTYYGPIKILKEVHFEVYPGEVVSLLGGNASGKTTTMKTIMGIVKPVSGTITFDGNRINGLPTGKIISLGIAPVPEARRLFPSMSVKENLIMGAYVHRRKSFSRLELDLEKVLDFFPRLRERLNQISGTLSGGEQQMVAVGRALMARPKMIIMDEPSMGLAPVLVERVYEIIKRIKAEGTTLFIVEQNATMALSVAKRGYVLQNGQIVLSDSAENLLKSEKIRKAYLGQA